MESTWRRQAPAVTFSGPGRAAAPALVPIPIPFAAVLCVSLVLLGWRRGSIRERSRTVESSLGSPSSSLTLLTFHGFSPVSELRPRIIRSRHATTKTLGILAISVLCAAASPYLKDSCYAFRRDEGLRVPIPGSAALPAPLVVDNGDSIALELPVSADGKQKVVDCIKLLNKPAAHSGR
jgi:hypothetical protein